MGSWANGPIGLSDIVRLSGFLAFPLSFLDKPRITPVAVIGEVQTYDPLAVETIGDNRPGNALTAAAEFLTVFFGSILMGVGAVIAGGCNLGHGVTGMSTMAVSSLVAIISIILGNWTMVYFKLIKPMQD